MTQLIKESITDKLESLSFRDLKSLYRSAMAPMWTPDSELVYDVTLSVVEGTEWELVERQVVEILEDTWFIEEIERHLEDCQNHHDRLTDPEAYFETGGIGIVSNGI